MSATAEGIDPLAHLLRGFAVDFLTCHDPSVVERIMTPDYRLHIGSAVFDGRDEAYLPATLAQLRQFPGLCVTVHDVILGENACAMRFTEHGASVRDGGRLASWRGITMFRTDGERLQRGWAEEDYLARKRQLATGSFDPVEAPHPAPWDERRASPDAAVEATVRNWINATHALMDQDRAVDVKTPEPAASTLISVRDADIDMLFTAGTRAAFHLSLHGTYSGGFADIAALSGAPITLRIAGMVDTRDGEVVSAQIFSDRLGLYRSLRRGMAADAGS